MCYGYLVRSSVRLSVTLDDCKNGCTIVHTLPPPAGNTIVLVFLNQIPQGVTSRIVLNGLSKAGAV